MNPPGRTSARAGVILDGRYQLDRPVGRGGMGMVFRATQLNLGRTVAVKVLPTDLLERGGEFEVRFRREALAISKLQHPNIVQVLDFGRDPHFGLYLVMEYLDGRSLDEVMFEDHPVAPRRAADLLIQALSALEAAHAASILHRDIKPANMMACDVPGRPDLVKVLDFGVARPLGRELDSWKLTRDGMVCGTPLYMAPEQATAAGLDARADVYAAGTVLYEMLAGHLPFDETAPMDCLAIKVAEDPPPLRALSSGDPVPRSSVRSACAPSPASPTGASATPPVSAKPWSNGWAARRAGHRPPPRGVRRVHRAARPRGSPRGVVRWWRMAPPRPPTAGSRVAVPTTRRTPRRIWTARWTWNSYGPRGRPVTPRSAWRWSLPPIRVCPRPCPASGCPPPRCCRSSVSACTAAASC